MLHDFRFALRMINAHRWFSAAVIITLALGIGINTTVFTLVNAVLFKPVPIPGGERLVLVRGQKIDNPKDRLGVAYLDFRNFQAANESFEGLEAANQTQVVVGENGIPPERARAAYVTTGLFDMLHTSPVIGRGFSANDDKPGAERVVLIGHGLWKNRYAGASDVIGRAVRIDGEPAVIIGVMPEAFKFPNNENVWMPLVPGAKEEDRKHRPLQLFGILKPGTSIEAARQDLTVIGARLATEFPDSNGNFAPNVLTFHDAFNGGEIRTVFLMMLGAVAFVLLIACANVANMLLSRAVARRQEISVRAAMGASRWQLVRQLLIESILLSCVGGALGLGLSALGVHAFDLATQDVGKPYWIIFSMDYVAFGYFAAISVASGVVFGLLPALRASRVDLNTALKDDSRSGTHRGGYLTGALVVLQFTLTVVLLAGAGMLMRSFFAAQSINAFIPSDRILTARISLPEAEGARYAEPAARRQFMEKLMPQLATLPGVTHAAATSHPPGMHAAVRPIEIEGRPNEDPKKAPQASAVVQTPGLLTAIDLPIIAGRDFEMFDGETDREVAVVTRDFAARHWPGESALGRRFRFVENEKPGPWITVVGVSGDVIQNTRDKDAPPVVYVPHRQEPWGWMTVMLRTSSDPHKLATSLRATVQKLDEELPLFDVRTLKGALEHDRWFLSVFGTLFLVFALIGLLMASVGIYAVVAQSTARRTREIGIRMALGATGGGIIRLVLSRGLVQLIIGLVLGLGGALAATRLLAQVGFLIRVSPNDPLVFAAVTSLLVAIGLFACWLPARRAAALHPVSALRHE